MILNLSSPFCETMMYFSDEDASLNKNKKFLLFSNVLMILILLTGGNLHVSH